jgi:hypothetical protein
MGETVDALVVGAFSYRPRTGGYVTSMILLSWQLRIWEAWRRRVDSYMRSS